MPGIVWLLLFFLAPLYVVLAIVFGRVDPIFHPRYRCGIRCSGIGSVHLCSDAHRGRERCVRPALARTAVYVVAASLLCLLIAFPVAYYTARLADRWAGVLLAALIARSGSAYMMRMLAWVSLLQDDGLVNRVLSLGGLFGVHPLAHRPARRRGPGSGVRLCAVHDPAAVRRPGPAAATTLEAARDLGANRFASFWRVTLPMSPADHRGGRAADLPADAG